MDSDQDGLSGFCKLAKETNSIVGGLAVEP
jgi:hypothetical protein